MSAETAQHRLDEALLLEWRLQAALDAAHAIIESCIEEGGIVRGERPRPYLTVVPDLS